jgi:ribosomal protein S27AE
MKFEKKAGMSLRLILAFALFVVCQFLLLMNGAAYLDPSTMTYVIQIVAGAVIAGGTAIAIFWHKIKRFFKKLLQGGTKEKDGVTVVGKNNLYVQEKTVERKAEAVEKPLEAGQPSAVESGEEKTIAAEKKTCPFCGAVLAVSTAKFCMECGAALRRKCPSCGVEITAAHAKFCAECGTALPT